MITDTKKSVGIKLQQSLAKEREHLGPGPDLCGCNGSR